MLLTIDIGNTNITLGLYEGEELGPRWRLATKHEQMPDEYGIRFLAMLNHAGFGPRHLTGICMASVVPPLTNKIVEACQIYLEHDPLVVDAGFSDDHPGGGDFLRFGGRGRFFHGGCFQSGPL